jgi:YHS domain-containing protein
MKYRETLRLTELMKDVVCGMAVDEKTAKFKTDYEGRSYYFCSQSCIAEFKANPGKYVKA